MRNISAKLNSANISREFNLNNLKKLYLLLDIGVRLKRADNLKRHNNIWHHSFCMLSLSAKKKRSGNFKMSHFVGEKMSLLLAFSPFEILPWLSERGFLMVITFLTIYNGPCNPPPEVKTDITAAMSFFTWQQQFGFPLKVQPVCFFSSWKPTFVNVLSGVM